jgi:hypothetical protein
VINGKMISVLYDKMPYILLRNKKIVHASTWATYLKCLIESPTYEYMLLKQLIIKWKSYRKKEKLDQKNAPILKSIIYITIKSYFKFPLAKGARIDECYLFALLLGNDNLEYFEEIIKHKFCKKYRSQTIANVIEFCYMFKQKNMLQLFLSYQTKLSPHEKYFNDLSFKSYEPMRIFYVYNFLAKKFALIPNHALNSRSDIVNPVDRSLTLMEMIRWIPMSYKYENLIPYLDHLNDEELIRTMKEVYGCTLYKPTITLWRSLGVFSISIEFIIFDILAELSLGYKKAHYSRIKLNPYEIMIDRPKG